MRVFAQVLDQRHELVAADARRAAGVAEASLEPPRDLDQQLVADFVAARFVDQLEIVEVDEQQRSAAAAAGAAGERLLEAVAQQTAIRQAGQPVVIGEVDDLFFGALALGDVGHRHDVVRESRRQRHAPWRPSSKSGRSRPNCVAPAFRRARSPSRATRRRSPRKQLAGARIARDLLRRFADHLVRDMAGHLDEGAVDAQDPLVGVEDDDALLRLERGGGDTKLLVDFAALRDVPGDADHADRLAGLVAHWRLEHFEPVDACRPAPAISCSSDWISPVSIASRSLARNAARRSSGGKSSKSVLPIDIVLW